jgi:hypothetical protein
MGQLRAMSQDHVHTRMPPWVVALVVAWLLELGSAPGQLEAPGDPVVSIALCCAVNNGPPTVGVVMLCGMYCGALAWPLTLVPQHPAHTTRMQRQQQPPLTFPVLVGKHTPCGHA